jgi:hypothetical protein
MIAIRNTTKRIHSKKSTATIPPVAVAWARLEETCGGGIIKRKAQIIPTESKGIQATPQTNGPKGTIQKLPASTAMYNTRKKSKTDPNEVSFKILTEKTSEINNAIQNAAKKTISFYFTAKELKNRHGFFTH